MKMIIEATVYPGMFEWERQVTINAKGQEVHLFASEEFVQTSGQPPREGRPGFLMVDIVGTVGDDYLVALPGEPQNATSRVVLTKEALQAV